MTEVLTTAYEAPADAGELYQEYGAYVRGLVRKLLGYEASMQDIEDVAADILEKLVLRDVIGMYDPGHVSDHNGQRVTWKQFLSAQVASRIPGKREQLQRRRREVLLCDVPAGESGTRWVDQFGGETWDDYPVLSDQELYARMRDYLATQPTTKPGPCSLLALFNELTDLAAKGEKLSRAAVQRRFGLSSAEAKDRMAELKAALKEAIIAPAVPKFEVGPLTLSAAGVRAAVDALRASKGNRVRPAFADAGHVLATAGTTWYLAFAREELRAYPELKRPKGTHSPGGHGDHIKRGLIHRLERMLAESGVLAPEVPGEETPLDRLESEIWHLTSDPGKVDEILELARCAYGV